MRRATLGSVLLTTVLPTSHLQVCITIRKSVKEGDHAQRVVVDGLMFKWRQVTRGMPQGFRDILIHTIPYTSQVIMSTVEAQ